MIDRIYGWRPPTLYIEQWMRTIPGLDRKRLSERMGVSAGTISKKLAEPEKIDQLWLAGFANALGLQDVTDLYKNPEAPTPTELLAGLSEQEREEVYRFADYVRSKRAVGSDILERIDALSPAHQQVAREIAETSAEKSGMNRKRGTQGN